MINLPWAICVRKCVFKYNGICVQLLKSSVSQPFLCNNYDLLPNLYAREINIKDTANYYSSNLKYNIYYDLMSL